MAVQQFIILMIFHGLKLLSFCSCVKRSLGLGLC